MRALLLFAIVPLLAFTFQFPFAASDANGGDCWSQLSTGEHEIGDGTAAHTFYIDDRGYALGSGIWIYQETNGIFSPHSPVPSDAPAYWWRSLDASHDLQRGGVAALWPPELGNDSEICTDDPNVVPDTFFF